MSQVTVYYFIIRRRLINPYTLFLVTFFMFAYLKHILDRNFPNILGGQTDKLKGEKMSLA